jgi:predicted transcriptional regulator of viral defense system
MTRTISASLAPLIAELELDQPLLVTLTELTELVERLGIRTPAKVVASRLRAAGWLLATQTPGVWEFAPGAHAGARGHGDPYIEVRAVLAADPNAQVALTGSSALWAHGLIDRAPSGVHVAVPAGSHVPQALKRVAHVSVVDARLTPLRLDRLPVQRVATVLVAAASRPTQVRSWAAILERLDDIVVALDRDELDAELVGRPAATVARLAYLISGAEPALADRLFPKPPSDKVSWVWFGPRHGPKRSTRRFGIHDTLLAHRPAASTSTDRAR